MTAPTRLLSGNPGEEGFGYSQATAAGGMLRIAGQVGRDNATGELDGPATLGGRCDRALRNVRDAAEALGGPHAELVSLQLHVSAPLAGGWDELAAAVSRFAADERPAISVVPVGALFSPDYLVEVSAIATTQPRTIVPDEGPLGPALGRSSAVRVGGQVHLAGHLPLDAQGQLKGATLPEQFAQVCAGLGATLQAAGGTVADIVATHVWVAGTPPEGELAALTGAHQAVFQASKPAVTLLFVPELPFGARVQISAVAELPIDHAEG